MDGKWSNWLDWSLCSLSCGGGKQSRSRVCDNPKPVFGGANCSGTSNDEQPCNNQDCPGVC